MSKPTKPNQSAKPYPTASKLQSTKYALQFKLWIVALFYQWTSLTTNNHKHRTELYNVPLRQG